ncbi:class I SAM-dependent methyltransferase [Lolliginicoccus levis]|uniref:class I SAM-dependent methyltransferase n=1 Tax=Lolliginicoccus levis TaxID=2919542 RepID=UPI00241CC48C|nr:class I SAM-dependent methyltransferase [Lolliginicoccus levis]
MRESSDRQAFDKSYWDQHWRGDPSGAPAAMPGGPPNPHLVREIDDLRPGTALEAGCGAGAEALWLAARGWQVTGVDIAAEALARAAERANATGVADRVQWVNADLTMWAPSTTYDLVTTHYAHAAMPQLEFYHRVSSWVSPGGTLLIAGHLDHDQWHGDAGPSTETLVTAAGITARLDPAEWEVATAEEFHRTVASHCGARTLHDVVVRAIRRR